MNGRQRLHTVRVSLVAGLLCVPAANSFGQSALPSPWLAADVGSPSPAGRTVVTDTALAITVGGNRLNSSSDQFHFVYQPIAGDVEVTARVDSLIQADSLTSAGVMIRASLAPDATHAAALSSAGGGVSFTRRQKTGAPAKRSVGDRSAPPRWVRVVRVGTTLTAYASADGQTWINMGSAPIALDATAYVGVVAASGRDGTPTTAELTQISVVPLSLPPSQQAQDVGAPAVSGSAQFRGGVYTVTGGGADIGGTWDQFHFVYQPVSGDVDIVARVGSLSGRQPGPKAGVMVRETLTGGARHALAGLTAAQGHAFERRLDPGGTTERTGGGAAASGGWVRLVRQGARFEAFQSSDGQNWTSIGSDTIYMAQAVYVGLVLTSRNTRTDATATFDSFRLTEPQPTTNQPPSVTVTTPENGTTVTIPTALTIGAAASDPENRLDRVEFFAGGVQIGNDTTSPFSASWAPSAAGTYLVTARAYDADGASTTGAGVSVVVNANELPSVTLTAPASNASFVAPAAITVSASASDPEGRLDRVEFYSGSNRIGTATAAPYSIVWQAVPAGTYALSARAFDANGGSATSATVSVTVRANQPPIVSLTSPLNGAAFVAPATIGLTASASDPEGQLTTVAFYAGSQLLGTDGTAPFGFTWSSVPAGSYSLRAVAYDAAGANASSALVSIAVAAPPAPTLGTVAFQASIDHATLVTNYVLDVFASGADPNVAPPLASSDLAKPTPSATGEITVDRAAFFSALAPGTYRATVSAIGSGGVGRSASITFTR